MKGQNSTVTACRFQPEGVNCRLPRDCSCCGWNPKVAEARRLKILQGNKIQEVRKR